MPVSAPVLMLGCPDDVLLHPRQIVISSMTCLLLDGIPDPEEAVC
jgi:hypothetical protein